MMKKRVFIAPSLLSANFSHMGDELEKVHRCGGDWIHLDVMDGQYVPQITFGSKMISDLRKLSSLPFDVHLMTQTPEAHIQNFARAGADYLTFHPETTGHPHRLIQQIKDLGVKAGVSLLPSTPVAAYQEIYPFVDLVLVMTVNPGFGGQEMIPQCLDKLALLREAKKERGYGYYIAVDGGMNHLTGARAVSLGAEVIIMGSAFFESTDPIGLLESVRGAIIV